MFGIAADWVESVAWRESGCQANPPHNNPARGVLQFEGHQDLLAVACPDRSPAVTVFVPDCAIRAAFMLFDQQGTAPWRMN